MKTIFLLIYIVFISYGVIFSGTITVDFPKQDDTLIIGRTYEIRWTKIGCAEDDIVVKIFKNSIAQENLVLQLSEEQSDGKISWTVPANFEIGNYIVRVRVPNVSCIGDSGVFKINVNPLLSRDRTYRASATPSIMKKPEITSVSSTPSGTLKPGSRVYVKGVDFGTEKGRIFMVGNFPGGQVELKNITWINHLTAQGFVPDSLNGYPGQDVEIVLANSQGIQSDPYKWKLKFTGREEKVLISDAVGVNCGTDGNCNACNKVWTSDSGYTLGFPENHAISGYHSNKWGAVGNDVGADTYTIVLKNGWVLKNMETIKWEKSSGDEMLAGPTPGFPTGSSTWTPVIHWLVTPNDSVHYELKIFVEGPIGTHYK